MPLTPRARRWIVSVVLAAGVVIAAMTCNVLMVGASDILFGEAPSKPLHPNPWGGR
jgi:hypothetical protein